LLTQLFVESVVPEPPPPGRFAALELGGAGAGPTSKSLCGAACCASSGAPSSVEPLPHPPHPPPARLSAFPQRQPSRPPCTGRGCPRELASPVRAFRLEIFGQPRRQMAAVSRSLSLSLSLSLFFFFLSLRAARPPSSLSHLPSSPPLACHLRRHGLGPPSLRVRSPSAAALSGPR